MRVRVSCSSGVVGATVFFGLPRRFTLRVRVNCWCGISDLNSMLDIQHLRDDANLLRLLSHYDGLAGDDRTVWQDRLMTLEGVEPPALARLHGALIAGSWIDINVGSPTGKRPGEVENSYRITAGGRRALRQAQAGDPEQDEEINLTLVEAPAPKGPPRRTRKPAAEQAA